MHWNARDNSGPGFHSRAQFTAAGLVWWADVCCGLPGGEAGGEGLFLVEAPRGTHSSPHHGPHLQPVRPPHGENPHGSDRVVLQCEVCLV